MAYETIVYDESEERVAVGSRIRTGDGWEGTVKEITDPEVDVDEDGSNLYLTPGITVEWDDEGTETLRTSVLFPGDDFEGPTFELDEATVVTAQ